MAFCESNVGERKIIPYVAYVPDGNDRKLAGEISSWIQGAVDNGGTMLPKTPEDMLRLFGSSRSVVLFDPATCRSVAHSAFTEEYPDNSLEVGAVIVQEKFRGNGASDEATLHLLRHGARTIPSFSERGVHALANGASHSMFIRTGFRNAAKEELHEDAWKLCDTCPRNPNKNPVVNTQGNGSAETRLCCDTPVTLKK